MPDTSSHSHFERKHKQGGRRASVTISLPRTMLDQLDLVAGPLERSGFIQKCLAKELPRMSPVPVEVANHA